MKAKRNAPQTKWIQSESGETYICPIDIGRNASEEELRRRCVNESENPQNH